MSNVLESFKTELNQTLAKFDALTLIEIEYFSKVRQVNRPEIFCIETEYDRETCRLVAKLKHAKEIERVGIILQYRVKALTEIAK
jgi:hypothetical protein